MDGITTRKESMQNPKIAYKAKPNEVIVFDKPFNVNGFAYDAIAQREDGALIIFDYKSYKIGKVEEETNEEQD